MKSIKILFQLLVLFLITSCNNSKDPIVLVSSAKSLSDNGEFSKAQVLLMEAIKIDNKYPDAYIELGRAYEEQGNLELAEKAYFKVLEVKPDHVYANLYISNLFRKTGKLDKALEYVNKALNLSHNEAWMYQLQAKLLVEKEDLEGAKKALDRSIQIEPNDHNYRNDLAEVCVKLNDKECALIQYKKMYDLLQGMPKYDQEILELQDKIRQLSQN